MKKSILLTAATILTACTASAATVSTLPVTGMPEAVQTVPYSRAASSSSYQSLDVVSDVESQPMGTDDISSSASSSSHDIDLLSLEPTPRPRNRTLLSDDDVTWILQPLLEGDPVAEAAEFMPQDLYDMAEDFSVRWEENLPDQWVEAEAYLKLFNRLQGTSQD